MATVIDPRTGDPVRPDGTRYAATEAHPFVLTANVAERGNVCHLCHGDRYYIVHMVERVPSYGEPAYVEPEWVRRARASALPAKVYRP